VSEGQLIYRMPKSRKVALVVLALFAAVAPSSAVVGAPSLGDVEKAFHSGDYETALQLAQSQVDAGIWNERWPQWLIRCQLTTGQYADARKVYQAVIKRYPTSLTLRHLGIEALRSSGESELAEKEEQQFFRILQTSPSRYTSRDNLIAAGRYFLAQGEDARQVLKLFYDRVRNADPRYVESYIATAELAIEKGDFQMAAETLQRAGEFDQTDPRIPYLTARAWESSDPQKAAAAIDTALRLNPNHILALLYRASRAIDSERYDAAEKIVKRKCQKSIRCIPNQVPYKR